MFSCLEREDFTMIEFYKTIDNVTQRVETLEPGCWINVVSPSEEEKDFLINDLGVLREFVQESLDEEESSHIDYDDDCASCSAFVEYRRCDYLQGPCLAIDDDLHPPAGKGS